MASAAPTGALILTAAVSGRDVYYTVHRSDRDRTEVKTSRFSQLHSLHKALTAEVPAFPGRFPSKTMVKKVSPAFVESRRKDIEMYLRLVATHQGAKASKAWLAFVSERRPARPVNDGNVSEGEDSEDDRDKLEGLMSFPALPFEGDHGEKVSNKVGESFKNEMSAHFEAKKGQLTAAEEQKQELEGSLFAGEEAIKATVTDAQDRAALEIEAAATLRCHERSLDELAVKLKWAISAKRDQEQRQSELAKRYENQLALTLESKKTADEHLASNEKAKTEASAKNVTKVAKAVAAQLEAEAANMAAIEGHAIMTAALAVVQEHTKGRLDELKTAERERDMFKITEQKLATESLQAEDVRSKEEVASKDADEAVSAHARDAAQRAREGGVEVRRAQARADDLAALKDMHTRGLLADGDRNSCKTLEDYTIVAADAASKALSKATQILEETQAADKVKKDSLEAAASKANKELKKRQTVAAALSNRLKSTRGSLEEASAKHTVLEAAYKAADKELQTLKQRFETLATPLAPAAARLEEANTAVAAAKREGEEEQANFQREIKAYSVRLATDQSEEKTFKAALEEARVSAKEAHGDAETPVEKIDDSRAKVDALVDAANARCVDLQKQAREAAEGYRQAIAAAEDARNDTEDLLDIDASQDSLELPGNESTQSGEPKAQLESQLKELDSQAFESKKVSDAAAAALATAKQELHALQNKQRATPLPIFPIEKLINDELAIVRNQLNEHKDKESIILTEAKEKSLDWSSKKVTLSANLHRVELEFDVATKDVKGIKDMAKELLSDKPRPVDGPSSSFMAGPLPCM